MSQMWKRSSRRPHHSGRCTYVRWSRSRWRLLAAVGLAFGLLGLGVAAASGASTAVSTFTKSGTDASTGSTATAGGAPGETAAGHRIDWVLGYRNETAATASVDITDPISAGQTYVPGSLRTPPGLSGLWSTDGGTSYSDSEPQSGVDAIAARGTSQPGSVSERAPVAPPSRGFTAGSSLGDGWEALFVGDNVYNIHHHRGPGTGLTTLDCHVKTTGATCPGYPVSRVPQVAGEPFDTGPDDLDTSFEPDAAVDAANGRIYFPVGLNGRGGIGVQCADVLYEQSCGYTQLADSPIPNRIQGNEGWAAISGGALIGSRYFLVDAQADIYCFDIATRASCGRPYPLKAVPDYNSGRVNTTQLLTALDSRLQTFDDRYVFGNIAEPDGRRDLTCLDTTTDALCPGFPIRSYATDYRIAGGPLQFNEVLAPILDARGSVTGICGLAATDDVSARFRCFAVGGASGSPVATPWAQQVPNDTVTRAGLGSITRIGTRDYFAYSNERSGFQATYTCWDFAIDGACRGFVPASSGRNVRAYTLRQDPFNPGCIWELGDAGVFEVFSATFGGTTCKEGAASVELAPDAYYCDGKAGHVTGWRSLVLGGLRPEDYDAVAVSITDANGDPVAGWSNRIFSNADQTIDISSIPFTGATTKLRIAVSIAWGAHPVVPASLQATFTGDPVQVCFATVVGPGQCAASQDVSNGARAVTVADNGDSDAPDGNRSGDATFTQAPDPAACGADLEMDKSAQPEAIAPGGDATYTLVVRNHGPDAAQGVVVTDRLPEGLSLVSTPAGCALAADTVTCRAASLAAGATAQFKLLARVARSVDTAVTNTATVTSATHDPNPGNDMSTTRQPLDRRVDVAITKTASPTLAAPGDQITYSLVVVNHGPGDATGVTVSDEAPDGLSLISAVAGQGSCTVARALSCSVGALQAGGAAEVLVTARVAPGFHGSLVNVAAVTEDQFDSNPGNNHAQATVDVPAIPPPPEPVSDLAIVKRVNSASASPGQTLTYTLEVSNRGPDQAVRATVTDTAAARLRVLSAHSTRGSCRLGTPLTCALGDLPAGDHVRITIVAQVTAVGDVENTADVTSDSRDPRLGDNESRAHTRVAAGIVLRNTASAKVVQAGKRLTFLLTVANPNPTAVSHLRVCDALPAGVVLVSGRPRPTLSRGSACWRLGTLASLATHQFTVTVRVQSGTRGVRVNRASATAAGLRAAHADASVRVIAPPPPSFTG